MSLIHLSLSQMWHKFFDKILLINLPERRDRYWISTWELSRYGMPYQIHKATKHPDGRYGLYLTMRALFQHCLDGGARNVLVFEDDLKFVADPEPVMNKILQQLPADWDLLYLGCNLAERPKCFFSENLIEVKRALSSHAVAYSRAAMQKTLAMTPILPFDSFLVQSIQKDGRSFAACPFLVTQYPGFSDIEHRQTDWTHVLDTRFHEHIKPILQECETESRQCCRA